MKMLLMMTTKTPTSFLLPTETPHGWPDIMQVILVSLQAASTQNMCSIDGVTFQGQKQRKMMKPRKMKLILLKNICLSSKFLDAFLATIRFAGAHYFHCEFS